MNTAPPLPKPTLLPSHPPETSETSFSSYSDRPGKILVLRKSKSDEKELDVFDAEKYFSEADHIPDKLHVPTHHTKDNPTLEIFRVKEPPHPLTPTASVHSQSSQNSRSALLHTLSISGNQQKQKKANVKSFLAVIGCKCSCADLNSIETNDRFIKQPPAQDHVKVKPNAVAKRSKPLQVIGSQDTEKNGKMNSLTEEVKITSISSEMCDGSGSDDSSDLFEIESLKRGDPHAYSDFLSMQTSDGCKSPACYAPSEASVEWSVITASAADFSVLSDSEELTQPKKNTKIGTTFKEMPRLRKSGLLSGCVSQKALRVSGEGDNVEDGFGGDGRNLKTESLSTRFGLRNRQQSSMEARVFSRQAAHPLYA